MLYDAGSSVSTPLALHAFRRVRWNDRQDSFEASPVGVGITRVPLDSVSALLSDLDESQDMDISDPSEKQRNVTGQASITSMLGWDELRDEIDESAAANTLAKIGLTDGDILDCVVKPDPSLATAPRSSGRPSTERFGHSRR